MSLLPTRIIDINSDNRTSGTNSNFTIQLPNLDQRYDRVSLVSASIPKTYYNIQAPYNTFIFQEGIQTLTITVPVGNYSFTSFASVIQSLLISNSFNSIAYICIPNLTLGKLQISSSNTIGNNPNLPNDIITTLTFPLSSNLYKNFGVNYISSNSFNSATPFISLNVCIFTINTIMINSSIVKSVASTNTASNILSMIGVNSSLPFSSITYENYSPLYNSRECQVSTSASFVITDRDGTELDLNGIPCNLTIMIYKYDNTNEVIRKDLAFRHAEKILNSE